MYLLGVWFAGRRYYRGVVGFVDVLLTMWWMMMGNAWEPKRGDWSGEWPVPWRGAWLTRHVQW
jgi:hypothetical protein